MATPQQSATPQPRPPAQPQPQAAAGGPPAAQGLNLRSLLEEMIARSRELKLRLAVPEDQARQEFAVLLTVQAMNYLQGGGHRVFL